MKTGTFDGVQNVVNDTPEQAKSMRTRAELVTITNNWIEQQGFSQAQAAFALGVIQPRTSESARSKIQIFSIDKLITITTYAGLYI